MSGITKDLDILKQLFENLSDTDKQIFWLLLVKENRLRE